MGRTRVLGSKRRDSVALCCLTSMAHKPALPQSRPARREPFLYRIKRRAGRPAPAPALCSHLLGRVFGRLPFAPAKEGGAWARPRWRKGRNGCADFSPGASGRTRDLDEVRGVDTRAGRTHARALPRDRTPTRTAERHARTGGAPVFAGALDRGADRLRRGVQSGEQRPEPFQ